MNKRIVQCDDCGRFLYPDDGDEHISILHYKGKKTSTDLRKDLCMECFYQYKRVNKPKKVNPWLEYYRKTKGGIADE